MAHGILATTELIADIKSSVHSGKDEGDLNFPYPITLTTFHLVYATIATRLMRRFTPLLDGLDNVDITWQRWYQNVSILLSFIAR